MTERYRTVEKFEITYPNGVRVHVTNRGVTIWDNTERRWVVDASCVADDGEITVNDVTKDIDHRKRQKTCKALYPVEKPKGKKERT